MLKKTVLAVVLALAATFGAAAQETGSEFKPTTGNVTTEVQLSLSTGSTVNLRLNQLRGRYFLSPTTAFRTSVTLEVQNTSDEVEFGNSTTDVSTSRTFISIAPGFEKHFAGTERLSPYVGAEVSISKLFTSQETATAEVEGAWLSGGGGSYANRNYIGFGVGAVAGTDYYVAKNLYLGVELGFGLEYRSEGDVEVTPKPGSGTPPRSDDSGASTFNLSPTVGSGIRVGFVF
ncbi:MAG: hypothetical protein ACO1OQ_00500 [Rufibacter sp.]